MRELHLRADVFFSSTIKSEEEEEEEEEEDLISGSSASDMVNRLKQKIYQSQY